MKADQDHITQFGDRRLQRKNEAKQTLKSSRQALIIIRRRLSSKAKEGCSKKRRVSDFTLGVGRKPWQHYANKRSCIEKAERNGVRQPRAEYLASREQWKKDFEASPAEQAVCQAECDAARLGRKTKVDDAANRSQIGMPPVPDDKDELQSASVKHSPDTQAIGPTTLWGAGCLDYVVSSSVLRAHAG